MAKSSTLYDRAGLSKDSGKNIRINEIKEAKPSAKALRFVLDYAKSACVVKSKSLNSIVIVNN
jgi:hypothetical protein